MSLSAGDQATIIAGGAALLVVLGGAVFKTATLRGDANARWSRRTDFAVAALDEKTIQALEELRDAVNATLPESFAPSSAITDPAPLSGLAAEAAALHKTRTRMEKDLVRIRKVGPTLIAGQVLAMLAVLGVTAYYGELVDWVPLRVASLVLLAVSALVLALSGAAWIVLQSRLATAEEKADTAGQIDLPGGDE